MTSKSAPAAKKAPSLSPSPSPSQFVPFAELDIDQIMFLRNPRTSDPEIPRLAASIKKVGVLEPIMVLPPAVDGGKFRGVLGSRSAVSSSQGLFQFLDSQWRHGLPYMVKDRLVTFGMDKQTAREWRVRLQRPRRAVTP